MLNCWRTESNGRRIGVTVWTEITRQFAVKSLGSVISQVGVKSGYAGVDYIAQPPRLYGVARAAAVAAHRPLFSIRAPVGTWRSLVAHLHGMQGTGSDQNSDLFPY
jgi:hypothetical protein